jgi:hypothetical protein
VARRSYLLVSKLQAAYLPRNFSDRISARPQFFYPAATSAINQLQVAFARVSMDECTILAIVFATTLQI